MFYNTFSSLLAKEAVARYNNEGLFIASMICNMYMTQLQHLLFAWRKFKFAVGLDGGGQLRRRRRRREGVSCWAEAVHVDRKVYYLHIFFIFLLGDSQKEMRRSFVFALSPIPTGNPDVFLSALWSLVLVLSTG